MDLIYLLLFALFWLALVGMAWGCLSLQPKGGKP